MKCEKRQWIHESYRVCNLAYLEGYVFCNSKLFETNVGKDTKLHIIYFSLTDGRIMNNNSLVVYTRR